MKELVSVCVPVYNGEKYIKDTMDMILNQGYDNLEIIVSDNCSTDGTLAAIAQIDDERVKVVCSDSNVGMGGNWNKLLDIATGEYVIIVCSDDFLLPGAISAKADVLRNNADVNLVFSSSYVMSAEGKPIFLRRPFRSNRLLVGRKFQKKLFTTKNMLAEPTNVMARRSAIVKTGYFDLDLWYTIDWDYWLRVLNEGDAYYIDKPLSGFRVHNDSATGSSLDNKDKILADESKFIEKHRMEHLIDIDEKMIKKRRRNIMIRLTQKIIFMKLNRLVRGAK